MDQVFAELNALKKKVSIGVIIIIVCFLLCIPVFLLAGPFGFIPFAIVIIAAIVVSKISKKYAALFKKTVVKSALEEVFDDLTFDPSDGISYNTISNTDMISMGNRFSSNDLITGKYNGVDFKQSDVLIQDETTDSEGHTQTNTIFRGRWMIFEFNKTFRCDLQVASKNFFYATHKLNLFGKKEDKFKRFKFENEEFNKSFRVFGQDQEEAFYLLTPQIMESLIHFKATLKAPIMFIFNGGTLHVAINNNKDAFEPKVFGKISPESEKERIVSDIKVITDFVDELAINRDIYKTEKE